MDLGIRSGNSHQFLVGPSGSDPGFDDLVKQLRSAGWRVRTFDDLPIPEPIPRRGRALIIVTRRDTIDTSEGQRVQALIREAGYVEGALGRSSVILLVEESAPRLSDTGLQQIRYSAGQLTQSIPAVMTAFGLQLQTPTETDPDRRQRRADRDMSRQVPIREQLRADDLRVPWLMVALVTAVAVLAGFLLFRTLGGGDEDADVADGGTGDGAAELELGESEEGATVTMDGVASVLAAGADEPMAPTTIEGAGGGLSGATATADGDAGATTGGDGSTATSSVTAPGVAPPDPVDGSDSDLAGLDAIDVGGDEGGAGSSAGAESTAGTSTTTRAAEDSDSDSDAESDSESDGESDSESDSDSGSGADGESESAAPARPRTSTPPPSQVAQKPPPSIDLSDESLPATCYVDLRKTSIMPQTMACQGGGELVVTGWAGPWHNEVWALAIGDGVTGTLFHELRNDGTTVGPSEHDLIPGVLYLNEADALYGVYYLALTFGADEQHIHLYEHPDRGGEEAILIFRVT